MPTRTGRLLLIPGIKLLTHLLCSIDADELIKVPNSGPLILAANHTGLVEVPILYTQLQPRPFTGMTAAYRWQAGWSRFLLDNCDAIPMHRGELDLNAIRLSLRWLEKGGILAIAPEGTRSHTGSLQRGHPGIIWLAQESHAPILPVAFFGAENFNQNIRHFIRSNFHVRVGEIITLEMLQGNIAKSNIMHPRQLRQVLVDQVMLHIAALLPPELRGVYSLPDLFS
jgi:1-acyl-sn-glycerol-3-phosphate acyltransferase